MNVNAPKIVYMARKGYDPWKKKSKAGMKILTGAFKVSAKTGKTLYKASNTNPNNKGCSTVLFMLTGILMLLVLLMKNQ